MKKYIASVFAAAAMITAQAQENNATPWMVKQLTNDAIQHVKVETSGGSISVAGAREDARIEIYVLPGNSRDRNASKEEIKKMLEENYELSVTAENHHLTAIAKPKREFHDWKHSLNISFKIYVPQNVNTHLTTSGGNINLSALAGTQDFTTSGGNLNLDHLSGHINGQTSGGNITFSELKDDIDLTTSGGNINAGNSRGNIKVTTSGGSLFLRKLDGQVHGATSGGNVQAEEISGELSASTSGGNINMSDLACSLETATSGGNITVTMKSLGKYVKISNSGGSVSLQLPRGQGMNLSLSAEKVNAEGLADFKGDVKKDRIEGSINGGGVPVNVHGGSRLNFSLK